ncbi:PA14 domain-containing protein [Paenibacillus sp. UNCCL117]|uniref:PA14 domain-containing protein n=1 Tax=unclassified Paenibacillus TaxID=185978 RepID=UPI000888F255|nr:MULTISPECIES: PA14 domain-containing protein [unclassified Paenibacillus]SDC02446.1 PA14 domain-containing protein [Paenibacillus sp. cl123]SFW36852.1 PA14 domain-containing protein [Paenibacillus sp. UNCCL117]
MKKPGWKRLSLLAWIVAAMSLTGAVPFGDSNTPGFSAAAEGQSYEDWRQQEVPFGYRSFYHAPWKSYMDTWDANRFLETPAIVFNVNAQEADATAQVLAESGIRRARIEIGWGSLSYEDDTKLKPYSETQFTQILQALKKHKIRPLVLLNANAGLPVPAEDLKFTLKENAAAGAKEIYLTSTAGIVPRYTGLVNMAYQSMYPVITSIDPVTGRCELSAPLPRAIAKGELTLRKFKYQPFSGAVFEGGAPNPAAQETLDGWVKYVATVTKYVKNTLGTAGSADAGFDLEVWNEYTFGSQFLDINNYYKPGFKFSSPISYSAGGNTMTGPEIILPLTINYVKNASNQLPGVKVISGFSNQRPWENGTENWYGMDGFSRHPYTGYDYINPAGFNVQQDKILDDTRTPSTFVPDYISFFPEKWFYAVQTEFTVRDLQPFPGPWSLHGRYANPGNGIPTEVWMSEVNMARLNFARELMKQTGATNQDPALLNVMHRIGSKSTLRHYTFFSHKGVKAVTLFAAKDNDLSNGVIPMAFFDELRKNKYVLTPAVREKSGPQLKALAGVVSLMKTGDTLDNPRELQVSELKDSAPRLDFKGDSSAMNPDRYEDIAILPTQLKANKFAVGYYAVTRNLAQTRDASKDPLDPARYDMAPRTIEVTLSNVQGLGAKVSAYDPIDNRYMPVTIKKATLQTITVQLETVDYPRFLVIEELLQGPVIRDVKLERKPAGGAVLSFVPNSTGLASISWGPYPARSSSTFKEITYVDEQFKKEESARDVKLINFDTTEEMLPARKGSWKWVGTIVPKYSETYTFIIESPNCRVELWVGDQKLVNWCETKRNGSIELKAGQPYTLTLAYSSPYSTAQTVRLLWASANQHRELVTAGKSNQAAIVNVTQNVRKSIDLPQVKDGDGVRIQMTTVNGITATFPQWNYDVRGVLWKNRQ